VLLTVSAAAGGLIGLSDCIDASGIHALRNKTPSPVNFPDWYDAE